MIASIFPPPGGSTYSVEEFSTPGSGGAAYTWTNPFPGQHRPVRIQVIGGGGGGGGGASPGIAIAPGQTLLLGVWPMDAMAMSNAIWGVQASGSTQIGTIHRT